MLAWDVLVLWGYLLLNLFIPFYILYELTITGRKPDASKYHPVGLLLGLLGGEHPYGDGVPDGRAFLLGSIHGTVRFSGQTLSGLCLHRRAGFHDPAAVSVIDSETEY